MDKLATTQELPPDILHPFSPFGRVNPYPAYGWLLVNAPVYLDKLTGLWLVTSHSGCSAVLRDPRFSAAQGQRLRVRDEALPASMLTTDPPDHDRLRRPGSLLLGPAALNAQTPLIEAEIGHLISGLDPAAEADAVRDIGEPLAIAVLSRILEIEPPQRAAFAAFAKRVAVNLDPLAGARAGAAGRQAVTELTRWLDPHVAAVAASGSGSPLARLAADPRLTRQEMLGILSLVVIGGFAPLAEFTGNALGRLLSPRGDLGDLGLAEAARAETAADELLRLDGPIPFIARVTTSDIDTEDGALPAGARVLAVLAAANRDPRVFTAPDEADLSRTPNPHLAFGAGPHFCLAAPMIRRVCSLTLSRLAASFPHLHATGPVLRWAPTMLPRKLTAFGIRLT
jgi:pimeloyl-[acyl-carrier protein] synthase